MESISTTDMLPRIGPVGWTLLLKRSVVLRVPGVIGANFDWVICGGPEVFEVDLVAPSI